jgi:hypothetical protein
MTVEQKCIRSPDWGKCGRHTRWLPGAKKSLIYVRNYVHKYVHKNVRKYVRWHPCQAVFCQQYVSIFAAAAHDDDDDDDDDDDLG